MKKRVLILVAISFLVAAMSGACRKAPAPPAAEAGEAEAGHAPAGTVSLTPEAVKGGGIAVEEARAIDAARSVKALGELEFDARRVAGVTARTAGRIEKLAAYLGDRVAAGPVLAEIYSPDYLAVQAEVLLAGERAARLKGGPEEEAARPFSKRPGESSSLWAFRSRRSTPSSRPGPSARISRSARPCSGVVIASQAVSGGHRRSFDGPVPGGRSLGPLGLRPHLMRRTWRRSGPASRPS